MTKLRINFCVTIVAMLLTNCGGKSSDTSKDETTEPQGIRIYMAPGSTTAGEVYGGPVPTDSEIEAIVTSPTDNGFVKLGTIGTTQDMVYEFKGTYKYMLIRVHVGTVSTSSTSCVHIDAFQLIGNDMYFSGATYSGYANWSSNDYDQDKIFDPHAVDSYWFGPPDSKYVALFGWVFIPALSWAP